MEMFISLVGSRIEEEPNLLFDKADTSAVHPQVYWGLRRFGPYDKSASKLRLVIIGPRDKAKQIKGLINSLNNGTSIMPGGMQRFFRCTLEIVDEMIVNSMETQEYERVGSMFTRRWDPRDVDVVIAYIPKTSRYFSNTPYYRLKAILASEGFVSQMITHQTFERLKWAYLNLASAIFSKAGYAPWVLESEMPRTDMILGISISNFVSYKHRAGERPRYIGYANIFDSYGKWMFFEGTAKPYTKDQSIEQLKELIGKAIEKFKAEKGFIPRNIVIHYYKRFGKKEIKATINILNELLGEDNYSIAFVSIDDSHPIKLYDLSTDDGSFPRGYYVYLGENDILLSTTGFTKIASMRMGTPRLLRIRLKQHPNEFLTINDVALQVLSLTKLDWATVAPFVREPVTLRYAREIAYLTAAISEEEWGRITRPEVNAILSKRPWFI